MRSVLEEYGVGICLGFVVGENAPRQKGSNEHGPFKGRSVAIVCLVGDEDNQISSGIRRSTAEWSGEEAGDR